MPLEELVLAAHQLDERTYRQEFQASFENVGSGLAYYAFDREKNVRPLQHDRFHPIFWSLDFNMNPMCSVLGQRIHDQVRILEELILPDSNTWVACEEFLKRTENWAPQYGRLNVYVYGDATGDSRATSASRTDWQIVRDFFGRHSDRYAASVQVSSSNSLVKDRVNCVNSVLCNHAGERRMFLDPRCKQLIRDFEQVHWKNDPHGNPLAVLDKSDPARTHASDAAGYYLAREFGMHGKIGFRSERLF